MTRKVRWSVAIGALTLAGLLVGGAVAGPAVAQMRGSARQFQAVLSRLNLTVTQKEQVRVILREEQPRMDPLIDEMIRTRRALFAAVTAPTPDEGAVRTAAEAAGKAAGDLAVGQARVVSRLRGVLSPEQQGRLDEAIRNLSERIEERVKLGRTIWREHMADFVDAL